MRTQIALALAAIAPLAAQARAEIVTLDFEGLNDNVDVADYYNGGRAGDNTGPGPNFGVRFLSGARSVIDSDAGGSGNIANEPSGQTALFFLGVDAAIMNVPAGFTNGFGTWYSTIMNSGDIQIWSEENATGMLLATIILDELGTQPNGGDPTGDFNRWALAGTTFSGTAKSVRIGGDANLIAFDNITFGDVPAPGCLALVAAFGVTISRRRRS